MPSLTFLLAAFLVACFFAALALRFSVAVPPGQAAVACRGNKIEAIFAPGRYFYWLERQVTFVDMRNRSVRVRVPWKVRGAEIEILAVARFGVQEPILAARIADTEKFVADRLYMAIAKSAGAAEAYADNPAHIAASSITALNASKIWERARGILDLDSSGLVLLDLSTEATRT